MGCSLEDHRVAVGLFVGILLNILTKKGAITGKRVKGLRVLGLAARFAVTTLLLMLLMAGVQPNPVPTFTSSEENHVADRTSSVSDSGNLIDTANGTANNSQQQSDRLLAAVNQLAMTVSELGDKAGHFEHSQNEKSSRIDQRLGVMKKAINTRLIDVEENQIVLRIDMDAMDYEFVKMTD